MALSSYQPMGQFKSASAGSEGRSFLPPISLQASQCPWRRSTSGLPKPLTTSTPLSSTTRPSSQPAQNSGPGRWDQLGAARRSGLQAAPREGAKQLLLEYVAGRVCLLPDLQTIPTTSVVHSLTGMGDPGNHPHVITQTWVDNNGVQMVKIRTCTSFGGYGIEARKEERHHHLFVEADKSQLEATSDRFFKRTYVNCSPGHEFAVEYQYLKPWPGSDKKTAIQFTPAAVASFNYRPRKRTDSFEL